jgi:hypothetical protein
MKNCTTTTWAWPTTSASEALRGLAAALPAS